MPSLSWNEIRQRAIQFSRNWEDAREERAEAQSFWNEFFDVFGMRRRTVATFEERVRTVKDTYGRIDLFWRGRLLAEHKSAGESIEKAKSQAFNYIEELMSSGRTDEVPRYVVVSNFREVSLFDLEPEKGAEDRIDFQLADFHKHVKHFAFIIGQKTHKFGEEDPANIEAAEIMAALHDTVEEGGYSGRDLERLLVRLLFCLFADDTGIFEPSQFELYLEAHTKEDGSDLGTHLSSLFEILDTPGTKRSKHIDEDLAGFPYVNGDLFGERLRLAGFNRAMRNRLIAACRFDWSRISPAIFGSLFQGIMDPRERRQIGGHYTTERDILKVIGPLFLDDLRVEFEKIRGDRSTGRNKRADEFLTKLRTLNFLDPACGCGNFLVVAYRELRRLELAALNLRHKLDQPGAMLTLGGEEAKLSKVDVDQFYGIEIGEWPARIAETALWLTDHQMNTELALASGNPFTRIPLKASPHIRCGNALRLDWNELIAVEKCSYVMGNPPFVGAKYQTASQRADVEYVGGEVENHGLLDYVTMWYLKAAAYIKGTAVPCAFVSTNSISQGEQVGVLWPEVFKYGVKIHFAHRTFAWQSEARGKAHVHVVIVGFGKGDAAKKRLFEYDDINAEPSMRIVSNINPYLVEANGVTIRNRSTPLCDVPAIGIGNKPIDGGRYLFTDEERKEFLRKEPGAAKFFRPWIGSDEFINGHQRWCLWLGDAPANELRNLPECRKRISEVRAFRKTSKSLPTQKLADTPRRFHVENFPEGDFLVIPEVSSERRIYIPIGYLSPPVICSNLVKLMPDATPFHFGVLTSNMHMAWVRQICGRLESRYRYSAKLVYNNYPWPVEATGAQRAKVEACAQNVLAVRQRHIGTGSTLADLYDPLTMPKDLQRAHRALDAAVDRCYRRENFKDDRERIEFLFHLFETITSPLAPSEAPKKRRRPSTH